MVDRVTESSSDSAPDSASASTLASGPSTATEDTRRIAVPQLTATERRRARQQARPKLTRAQRRERKLHLPHAPDAASSQVQVGQQTPPGRDAHVQSYRCRTKDGLEAVDAHSAPSCGRIARCTKEESEPDAQLASIVTQASVHFAARKRTALAQIAGELEDRSPKGSVDRPIVPLVRLFFEADSFFTTSSCSGRVALFADVSSTRAVVASTSSSVASATTPNTKAGLGGWLFVSHEPVTVGQLRTALQQRELAHSRAGVSTVGPLGLEESLSAESDHTRQTPSAAAQADEDHLSRSDDDDVQVYLRFEPFVMHVCCRSIRDATALHQVAMASGFRESGISVSTKGKVMVGIRTTSLMLIIPLYSYQHLSKMTTLMNERFEKNAAMIQRLTESVEVLLSAGSKK
mmetsp:Transcript_10143/g.31198  ORF Transcript_10143/g.31198 Transcript_10143/m.31198 type:complete len:404 (-) Transcript_10143:106-1317(-)|eukprot:CAMPEP_0177651128 /NCGR_PEP_ID=MMETSP0447-20121125/12353_1 /TAXON_ID=0 /ORGANISM="Stygamoeba regulata, Strain BSH-02190019" /LENGTH=403 /DNA_ID=CAMNT_0019154129 /DNA_START=114 /DNA_END=1322 /DNA_ORIENTATION=+